MQNLPPPPPGFTLDTPQGGLPTRPVYQEGPPPPPQRAPQTPDEAQTAHLKLIEQRRALGLNDDGTDPEKNTSTLSGPQLLQSLPKDEQALVQGMLDGRIAPPTGTAAKAPEWQQRLKWAAQIDPTFDANDFAARAKARASIQTGALGKSQNALNTAIGHAASLLDLIPDVASHDAYGLPVATLINKAQNAYERAASDPGIAQWNYNANQLANELEAAYTGGQGTEQGRERQLQSLSPNLSADAKRKVIHKALDLLASKVAANYAQYSWAFRDGKPTWDMLDHDALAALQKYAPDVLAAHFSPPSNGGGNGNNDGNTPPNDGGTPPPPGMGPSSNGFNETPDTQSSTFWENAARQGMPYQRALGLWKRQVQSTGNQVVTPPPPDAYGRVVETFKTHPNVEYHPFQSIIRTPVSQTDQAVSQAALSGPGAFTLNAVNGAAAGIPLAAAGDQGKYFQSASEAAHPTASFTGDLIGSTAGMIGGEGLAARAGLKAGLKRELASNMTYGAVRGGAENPDNRIGGAITGSLAAGAGTLAGNLLTRGAANALRGASNADANVLLGSGVDGLTLGQIAGGKLKSFEDKLTSLPWVGEAINARRTEGVRQFNAAAFDHALKPIGASVKGATGEEAVAAANDAVSQAFNSALKGKAVTPDEQFIKQARGPLERLANNKRVGPEIVDAIEQSTSGLFDESTGSLSGEHMQAFLQSLRQIKQGYRNDPLYATLIKPSIQGIENSVEGMFSRQAPEVMPQYNAAKAAYRRLSTLADAVKRGTNTEGVFTPGQLGLADRANAKKYDGAISAASGNSPFFELQRAGQNVLPNKVPDSGTAGRLAMLAGPGGLTAAGAGLGFVGGDTKSGAEGGLGLSALLALAYTRAGQQRLAKLLMSRSPAAKAAAEKILKLAPPVNAAGAALTESTAGQ